MAIEEWKEKLEGAEPDGWCAPGVRCEICHRDPIGSVEILKVRRPEATYYYYVCLECQAKQGIKW